MFTVVAVWFRDTNECMMRTRYGKVEDLKRKHLSIFDTEALSHPLNISMNHTHHNSIFHLNRTVRGYRDAQEDEDCDIESLRWRMSDHVWYLRCRIHRIPAPCASRIRAPYSPGYAEHLSSSPPMEQPQGQRAAPGTATAISSILDSSIPL